MRGTVLITDSLFIHDEHVKQIEAAGYAVERLDKPEASEAELCKAIVGKVGYILGGIERVSKKVIEAADELKVISFTGSGYTEFIPGYQSAKKRGIRITAAVGANADAVAEYALTFILMATRRIPLLTLSGGASFLTTRGIQDSTLGIVGYGHIGSRVAKMASELGYSVLVSSRSTPKSLPKGVRAVKLDLLCKESDIVSIHVDKQNGENVLNAKLINQIKNEGAVVNCAFPEAVDRDAIRERLIKEELLYCSDAPAISDKENVPVGRLVQSNAQTAFNTISALKNVSDRTTQSLLNVLESGEDEYIMV